MPRNHARLFSGDKVDYAFHTDKEKNPWAKVDLGAVKMVNAVVIENRANERRAEGLILSISEDGQKVGGSLARQDLGTQPGCARDPCGCGAQCPGASGAIHPRGNKERFPPRTAAQARHGFRREMIRAIAIHSHKQFMMKKLLHVGIFLVLVLSARAEQTGPWNMAALSKVPQATWGEAKEQIQEVYYEGETFKGKPTRVFAYYGKPDGAGPFPGIVLVHGGGGTAFRDWVKHWVKNGYAALAMDLAGKGPAGRLPDGGPDQGDDVKFRDFGPEETRDIWTYQAVAAVIRGHSLLASLKEVDPERTALTASVGAAT